MPEIARLSTERPRLQPQEVFDHPREIVEQFLLTRGQKLGALRRWREQVEDRLERAEHGLTPPDDQDVVAATELV